MLETIQNALATGATWTSSFYSSQPKKSSSQEASSLHLLPQYSLSDVSEHYHPNDCWIVVYDRVYDATEFINEHPGGEYIIMEHAGRDCTLAFRSSRHSTDAYDMLEKYCIGILIENERLYTPSDEQLLADASS